MDFSSWWWIVIAVTFTLAWCLSRYDIKHILKQKNELPSQYFTGLKHLLNEEPDLAIDAFIQVAKLDPNTLDLHLSLGQMFRRQGEFSRAIRLHTYLSERTDLDFWQKQNVSWQLAQDYYKAGMYDRAENILNQLLQALINLNLNKNKSKNINENINENKDIQKFIELKKDSIDLLLKIANWEQDWSKALHYLQFHEPKTPDEQKAYQKLFTHLSLNQIQAKMALPEYKINQTNQNNQTNIDLFKVIEINDVSNVSNVSNIFNAADIEHPRFKLMQAMHQILHEDYLNASQICLTCLQNNPHLLSQVLAVLQKMPMEYQQDFWQKYLKNIENSENIKNIENNIKINEQIIYHIMQEKAITDVDKKNYLNFLMQMLTLANQNLALNPAAKTALLACYTEISANNINNIDQNILLEISKLLKQQKNTKHAYICDSCGFQAKNFSWNCPGCREWDTLQIL